MLVFHESFLSTLIQSYKSITMLAANDIFQVIKHSTSRRRRSKEYLPPSFVSDPATPSNSFVGTEEYIAPV
jgi:hypothetical protein